MPTERDDRHTTTMLLNRFGAGDRAAGEELLPLVYDELHRLARSTARNDETLRPTALVNEAWLRLIDPATASFENRQRFFAMAGKVMRSVIVDHARARGRLKRGAGRAPGPLFDEVGVVDVPVLDLLALDEALERLEALDPELVRLVESRFFGGRSLPEIAEATGTPLRTLERRWTLARTFLYGELSR